MAVIDFQGLVLRPRRVVEELAARRPGRLVFRAMRDPPRQGDLRKARLQFFVSLPQRAQCCCGLSFVGDQRIRIQCYKRRLVAREIFVLQLQHAEFRRP